MIPKRSFASLLLFTCLTSLSPAFALVPTPSNSSEATISAIEAKLFTCTHKAEPDATRVARIEKFVFGSARSEHTLNERVAYLAKTISTSSCKRSASNASPRTAAKMTTPQQDYPRVSHLENFLFGESFSYEPIAKRLDRLEQKEFGRVSSGRDLAVRMDSLLSYASQETSTSSYNSDNASRYAPSQVRLVSYQPVGSEIATQRTNRSSSHMTVVDQIESLEMNAFGKTRPEKPLLKRVSALEERLNPGKTKESKSNEAEKNISQRVTQLWMSSDSETSHTAPVRIGA